MNRFRLRRSLVLKLLMVLSLGLLTGADVECDLEDGEIEFDLPSFDLHHDDVYYDDVHYHDVYYDDWYYEPCDFWCW